MRMNGSWHIYRPGERWQRPAREMRILVATDDFVAVGFSVPVAELLTARELSRHKELQALGPDPLADDFDGADVLQRMRGHPRDAIADALLNQRIVAGIGNVFKSEICWAERIFPFTAIADLDEPTRRRIYETARHQLTSNLTTSRRSTYGAGLAVYGRRGRRCPRCGEPIASRRDQAARSTYWCPRCQPAP
jgi:endonuclease-8